ncbi:protein piccolo isoform X2 [Colias croceus]|uniref:protein piccolo isoform X2 n=1 Tax=Colias crocea TaxID=72248 RepID=UPI001E279FD2|nr:protein piccolo isoform X2 [Colias croceus]
MVVGENKRTANIMDGIENTGDVRLHDHRLRLKQRFDIVRKLGQGTYGKVQLGINKKTGQEVAIKTIKKCKIETEADLVRIRREVQIMSSVRHPNIVHIYEVFENSEKMILVMEYCSGGELYDYLSQKKVLEEDEARRLFRQIATAVYYCHIHKICHRDLKLENVLLDDTGSAKIADFGLSNVFKETSLLSTFCGSPLYASPEIVKGTPYIGPEVDCWSLGVLLYTLVYGAMPFDGSNFKRLVRQISNGDYYEPKNPSTASPLIRDMLTVDPLKRADIVYICDHPWVNTGCETSCLEMAEALAAQTPVRLDLLLSLAPAAPSHSNSVVVPNEQSELGGPDESCTDLTSSTSMAVEPSNSAEKRILELVAEGGEDAIKPSPTRTIVSASDNKRKLELAMSASGLQRKKERVASCASIAGAPPALPEEASVPDDEQEYYNDEAPQQSLKSSATMTITPAPATVELSKAPTVEIKDVPKDEEKPKVVSPKKPAKIDTAPEKLEETKVEDNKTTVSAAADKLTSLSLAQPAQPATPPAPAPVKPKKLSIGGHVGSFKEQFERRASLTTSPEIKRNVSKPVVSKIAKPKAQSEDRELSNKPLDNGTVRLQQIGIEPPKSPVESNEKQTQMNKGGVKKTESEPANASTAVDPAVLLQDARRSLQSSMAKLVEERAGEESRRRAARDIISTAIRTGKPPVPYGRSSSAGVTSLASPPSTPPASAPPRNEGKLFRTEAHHRVEDHRNRGVSVERIIPISMAPEDATSPPPGPAPVPTPPTPAPAAHKPAPRLHTPLRRLASTESTGTSEASPSSGEPIKKSAREFIIPIAVEGKGYVTPRQRSLEPESAPRSPLAHTARITPRRISSLVSGGESEEEDDTHMHRLRSSRLARAESVSSGEEDEEDEGFHLLTAENLFSTLLHRVRALTQRLNGEEGTGFQHPHSLFNNLHTPFFNRREGWSSRDMQSPFDSMFSKSRAPVPRGSKKGKSRASAERDDSALDLSDLDLSSIQFSEREMRALSGLTPALSRRLQRELLAHLPHLPPRAARELRRTLSLSAPAPPPRAARTPSAHDAPDRDPPSDQPAAEPTTDTEPKPDPQPESVDNDVPEVTASHFCTLPRLRRRSSATREVTSPTSDASGDYANKVDSSLRESSRSRSGARDTPDRPLLRKYLTDRTSSLDETYTTDGGSILTDPSYIAAYGSPALGNSSSLGFRRHSMRLSGDQPRKRISRFLRSDFFESPPEESLYAKHKKEKELETQKILKEIREKKNKCAENVANGSTDVKESQNNSLENDSFRKCLSPTGILLGKDRSRSNTPFFPILDNIKENIGDSSSLSNKRLTKKELDDPQTTGQDGDVVNNKDTKLVRPKSYPAKNVSAFDNTTKNIVDEKNHKDIDAIDNKQAPRESKLLRPKSYPNSTITQEKSFLKDTKKDESKNIASKENSASPEMKSDIEVSFNITLPRKSKVSLTSNVESGQIQEGLNDKDKSKNREIIKKNGATDGTSSSLVLKKYQIVNSIDKEKSQNVEQKIISNGSETSNNNSTIIKDSEITKNSKITNNSIKKDDSKLKNADSEQSEKKVAVKKKIIKKVSSKSKTDLGNNQDVNDTKSTSEKKKVVKKQKDKTPEDSSKTTTTTKKKSMLQSIGHKLEKFTSSKSNSPEKSQNSSTNSENKKETSKLSRTQREHSVPVEPPTESNLIKRAVTITDVAALENQNNAQNKTTVSKVLGLFKKFDAKDKSTKAVVSEKPSIDNLTINECDVLLKDADFLENDNEKARRPSSLLLNGLNRKSKYNKANNDNVNDTLLEIDEKPLKNEIENESSRKNIRNSLKLDFSKLPRVKKIVPTNPVIEPQIMDTSLDKESNRKIYEEEKNGVISDGTGKLDLSDTISRSRSRSRSVYSNSDVKSDQSAEIKDKNPLSPSSLRPLRSHDSTTPEKEDIVDRIRRKSFYSRFNEKKQRRKSNLVGPGATEYDPVARLYSQPSETKYDVSPTSPSTYDLSPGYSVASDLSPSTDRYRSLLADLPVNTRSNLRYDGINDKVDTYRSLDRNDLRKYSGGRSYLDYDQPLSYSQNRYSRTKSLMDSSDGTENLSLSLLREPQKYNRTNSMYSPGNYATYRPKRTRNPAIILKESEKEPSPENILEKIRQRKYSISVTRKPEPEKDSLSRSTGSPKSEGDGTERSAKGD